MSMKFLVLLFCMWWNSVMTHCVFVLLAWKVARKMASKMVGGVRSRSGWNPVPNLGIVLGHGPQRALGSIGPRSSSVCSDQSDYYRIDATMFVILNFSGLYCVVWYFLQVVFSCSGSSDYVDYVCANQRAKHLVRTLLWRRRHLLLLLQGCQSSLSNQGKGTYEHTYKGTSISVFLY